MATNINLPPGAFLTSIGGKKCTAVPRIAEVPNVTVTTSSLVTTTTLVSSVTTTTNVEVTTSVEVTSVQATTTAEQNINPPAQEAPAPPPTTTTVATTSEETQITTTSAEIQTTVSPEPTETQAIPTSPSPPALDSTTTIGTALEPVPTTTENPIPLPLPVTDTSTLVAPVAPPDATTSTNIDSPAPSSVTSEVAQPPTTVGQPGTGTTTIPTGNLDSVEPSTLITSTPPTIVTSTPSGVPVLAGPEPTGGTNTGDLVSSTNQIGEIVLAPTRTSLPEVSPTQTLVIGSQETALSSTAASDGMSPETTAAIAGGVAGTIVLLIILALLFWWRRRRRNGGNSPTGPTFADRALREKEPYVIMRSSIGPTPASEKFKASLSYKYKQASLHVVELGLRMAEALRLRKRSDVDLDRGLSQYGPLMSGGHSRSNSGVGVVPTNAPPRRQNPDWWDRLTEDGETQNWTIKAEDSQSRASSNVLGSNLPPMAQTTAPPVPVTRVAAAGTGSYGTSRSGSNDPQVPDGTLPVARTAQPRQTAPSDHFLSNLGMNFEPLDPFSDANSMSHVSAMIMPLAAPAGQNPFSDDNAISNARSRGPSNYVQGVQHARRESQNAGLRSNQPDSMYRDSTISQESFQTRRNRVRSDPFDLDRPELLSAGMPANAGGFAKDGRPPTTASSKQPAPPRQAHVRKTSASSSVYSGEASESGWSDPGPDVGPGVGRNWGHRNTRSNGSQGSVGKAM